MKSNREKCAVNVNTDNIPEVGLGRFVEGYNNKKNPFLFYKYLWWLLVPVVGWILVVILLLICLINYIFQKKVIVYIYEDGFLWYCKKFYGKESSTMVRFGEIGDIQMYRTYHFRSVYGSRQYLRTDVDFQVYDNMSGLVLNEKFSYVNKEEDENKYNALAYAALVIIINWNTLRQNPHTLSDSCNSNIYISKSLKTNKM